ncbi:hypothetical protein J2W51_005832 [Tardiphaga robiniae]|nr:hypothetical protein [Tardiphaga robiniae]
MTPTTVAQGDGERVAVAIRKLAMNIPAVDRAIDIYGALSGHSEAPGVRAQLSQHLDQLHSEGETDHHRLTVHGLSFLRQNDLQRNS